MEDLTATIAKLSSELDLVRQHNQKLRDAALAPDKRLKQGEALEQHAQNKAQMHQKQGSDMGKHAESAKQKALINR